MKYTVQEFVDTLQASYTDTIYTEPLENEEMARSIEDRVPVELRRSSRISARIRNTIDEEKNDEPIGKQESAGSRKRKRASSDVDGLEDHDNDDDAQVRTSMAVSSYVILN